MCRASAADTWGSTSFFAISGFLLTADLLRAAQEGTFSASRFYLGRVRRIAPALVLVSAATTPFALWLMLPDHLENFGQSLLATLLSANNVLAWQTTGYWATESSFKPLLHTWSLGVEEQFYLVLPPLVALGLRIEVRRGPLVVLAVLSAASLAASEWGRAHASEANFYLLPSRFWEIGAGSLTAILRPSMLARTTARTRHTLVGISLVALSASLISMGPEWALPGLPSSIPVGATCLVLALGGVAGPGVVLTARPLVWTGVVSYSLYLWHQPAFAFLRLVSLEEPSTPMFLAVLAPIGALSFLTWRWVEQPCRDRSRVSTRTLLLLTTLPGAALVALGAILHTTSGLVALRPEVAEGGAWLGTQQNIAYNLAPRELSSVAFDAAERDRNILVIGNSFARDFINMMNEAGAWDAAVVGYAERPLCAPWDAALTARVSAAGSVVLGSGVTERELPCARRAVQQARALGVAHVLVLGIKGFGYSNEAVMLLPPERRYAYRAPLDPAVISADAAARRALAPEVYVSFVETLDDGAHTVPVFTPDRQLISQDRRHLTPAGARFVGREVLALPQLAWLRALAPGEGARAE
ncbi:MAG: acyltransferase [Deltaproteobacteria bacterium]|nr:acyltransferase [Deltaproteobacteria bacterium]